LTRAANSPQVDKRRIIQAEDDSRYPKILPVILAANPRKKKITNLIIPRIKNNNRDSGPEVIARSCWVYSVVMMAKLELELVTGKPRNI
jgi:hypothetical protein